MAQKKNKETEEQQKKSAKNASKSKKSSKGNSASMSKKTKSKKKEPKKGKDGKAAKPSIWSRIIGYFKDVKTEMQRVVWPTRPELFNAALIVIGALIFFGVLIAIVDNLVIFPLQWISALGK